MAAMDWPLSSRKGKKTLNAWGNCGFFGKFCNLYGVWYFASALVKFRV